MRTHLYPRFAFFFVITMLPTVSLANGPGVVAATGFGSPQVAAYIEMNAGYVVVPVAIRSSAENPLDRLREVERLHKRVVSAAKNNPEIDILSGYVSSSPSEVESYPRSNYKVYQSDSVRASSRMGHSAEARVRYGGSGSEVKSYLLFELEESMNVLSVTRDATQFISGIGDMGHAKASLNRASLGVDYPEQYRSRLLEAIAKEVELLKKHLSPNAKVEVRGLESPVRIRQKDARVVYIFLDYSISLSY